MKRKKEEEEDKPTKGRPRKLKTTKGRKKGKHTPHSTCKQVCATTRLPTGPLYFHILNIYTLFVSSFYFLAKN